MSNVQFKKLTYPRVNPSTFHTLKGLSVPAKSAAHSGMVGKFVHQYICTNLNISGNTTVDIAKYGIEIKTKNKGSRTDWSIGSMTVSDIIKTPYEESPIFKKMQAMLLVTTDDSLQIICDVGLYYMDFDEIQTLIKDTYEDARSQLAHNVYNQQQKVLNTLFGFDVELKFENSESFKGTHGRFEYMNSGNTFNFRINASAMKKFVSKAAVNNKFNQLFT